MAGSWSESVINNVKENGGSPFGTIEWVFIGDAANGAVPDLVIPAADRQWMAGKSFYMAEIIPGTDSPTADYDITIEDASGDIFEDALKDLSATLRARIRPKVNGKEDVWPYDGRPITIKVANTTAPSAQATVRLFMWR